MPKNDDPRPASAGKRPGWMAVTVLLPLGLAMETAVFLLAAFAWCRSMAYTFAESAAGAIILVFMALSLVHQIGFYSGSPLPALIVETVAVAALLLAGRRRLPGLRGPPVEAIHLWRKETLSVGIIAAGWLAMMIFVVVKWGAPAPAPIGSVWQRLLTVPTITGFGRTAVADPIPLLNAPALFTHTTRFGLAPNALGVGIMAHMAVGFSTYALARRHAWPPMALIVSLLVLSMPRLIFVSLFPSAETISTAAVVFAVLLVYRLVEQHRPWDLRLFFLTILFSIHANPMSIALVPVLTLLLILVMLRRHGRLLVWELISDRPLVTGALLLPFLLLAQIPGLVLNQANGHPLLGSVCVFETDGIIGAVANLVRFVMVSCDPTQPVQEMLVWMVGLDLKALLMGAYGALMTLLPYRQAGGDPFALVFSGGEAFGFGPFVLILVLPAMAYALLRGPRRLKALGMAWMGYLYLAALVMAWQSGGSLAALCPMYAANGFLVAFSLPAWRLRRRGMRMLQIHFFILMAWTLASCWRLQG